ncbi:MAG TPA: hypothetical protein VEC60_21005 [Reyranella sp.]|nr:hypothetical protein [Reyranella sp.]
MSRPPLRSPIGRFLRTVFLAEIAVVAVAAIAAAAVDWTSASCVRAPAALGLFWLQLALELFVAARIVAFRRSADAVAAYRAETASLLPTEHWLGNRWFRVRLVGSLLALGLLALAGGWHLAFGGVTCGGHPVRIVLDGWLLLCIGATRALCLAIAYHLGFMPAATGRAMRERHRP